VFWVVSVYFNIRNTLPKSGTFLLGHPVYVHIFTYVRRVVVMYYIICGYVNFVCILCISMFEYMSISVYLCIIYYVCMYAYTQVLYILFTCVFIHTHVCIYACMGNSHDFVAIFSYKH
jgi:hypothetical protein